MRSKFFCCALIVLGWMLAAAGIVQPAIVRGPHSGGVTSAQPASKPAETAPALVARLGAGDFAARSEAARTIRRLPAEQAVPALIEAASRHPDDFVRFRALVLLSGFNDPGAASVFYAAAADPKDRVRQVAFHYLEKAQDTRAIPTLLRALERETNDFVRPALVSALSVFGNDARVRETLLKELGHGPEFYRSTVIAALGEHHAEYAVAQLLPLAQRAGPLQNDAVLALGRIGDRRVSETLAVLQRSAPDEVQPAIAAALCILGVNCEANLKFLTDTIAYAASGPGREALLRAALNALTSLAASGDTPAGQAIFESGDRGRGAARAPLALAAATVALKAPEQFMALLGGTRVPDATIALVGEGFDMLEEDFAEEQFYAAVRRMYWSEKDGSATKALAEKVILKLDF